MKINWNSVISVVVGMAIFTVLKGFVDGKNPLAKLTGAAQEEGSFDDMSTY